jgi:hypothetical protein
MIFFHIAQAMPGHFFDQDVPEIFCGSSFIKAGNVFSEDLLAEVAIESPGL